MTKYAQKLVTSFTSFSCQRDETITQLGSDDACCFRLTIQRHLSRDVSIAICDPGVFEVLNYACTFPLAGESLQVDRATKNKYIDGICRWKDGMLVLSKPFRGPATQRILGSSGTRYSKFNPIASSRSLFKVAQA